jgi:hypothetical protein
MKRGNQLSRFTNDNSQLVHLDLSPPLSLSLTCTMTSATFTALTWKRFTATAIASTTKSSSTSQLFIPKSLSQRRTIASSSFFHQRQQAHSSSTITKTSPVSAPTPVPTSTPSSASPLADLTAEPTETQLPILPRPLGQKEPPTTAQKTWQEKKEEMLDRGKRLEKRKALYVSFRSFRSIPFDELV